MPEHRLSIRDVRKVFKGGWGLHGVSLDVPAGQIVALGGPNGSGKSTLLKCLAGLMHFEGVVHVDGVPVDGSPRVRESIGYLPQIVGMPEYATIGEMLDLFADLRGVSRETIPLPEGFVRPDDVRIGVLSGGQRHRVALAIALMGDPSLLLLDEPVANLDEEGRETFWATLLMLRERRGVSALVSSPAPSELRRVADRGVYMEDGKIVLQESFEQERGDDVSLEALG